MRLMQARCAVRDSIFAAHNTYEPSKFSLLDGLATMNDWTHYTLTQLTTSTYVYLYALIRLVAMQSYLYVASQVVRSGSWKGVV